MLRKDQLISFLSDPEYQTRLNKDRVRFERCRSRIHNLIARHNLTCLDILASVGKFSTMGYPCYRCLTNSLVRCAKCPFRSSPDSFQQYRLLSETEEGRAFVNLYSGSVSESNLETVVSGETPSEITPEIAPEITSEIAKEMEEFVVVPEENGQEEAPVILEENGLIKEKEKKITEKTESAEISSGWLNWMPSLIPSWYR